MTYQQRADRIAELIEERLGIRGKSLERKLHKAGRLLPRAIQRDGAKLVEALRLQQSPKMARLINEDEVQKAFQACERYLSEIDPWERRKAAAISFLSTNAFNLAAIAAVVVVVLVWRGYL